MSRSHSYLYTPDKNTFNNTPGAGVDLREYISEPYNQLSTSSCASHAVAGALELAIRTRKHLRNFVPSWMYIWYYARLHSRGRKAVRYNYGTSIKDALDTLREGVCREERWLYQQSDAEEGTRKFLPGAKAAQEPDRRAKLDARNYTATYSKIHRHHLRYELIDCLDTGFPFIFWMKMYGQLSAAHINKSNQYTMSA
ncbi:hypothetical protein F5Y11DRAFT_348129 [Daldinia sp. FL1419]|nr:hypothetical protein F5Y11DRAFT_348129 [Daldinia sp. FL1419]